MQNDDERNSTQIIRKDGKNCFLEVKSDAFPIGKVHMQFVTYNTNLPQGKRCTNNVHIYIRIEEFVSLAQEASSGILHQRMSKYKQDKNKEPLYQCIGGTSAERLKEMGQERSDGKSLSRVAKLIYAEKNDYLFIADSGPGETNAKGLIVPRFGKEPENHVAISLSWRQLNEILFITQINYQAWLSAQYITMK